MTPDLDHDLLRDLVAFDTRSSVPNLDLAEFIADRLDRPGVRIERHEAGAPGKMNLIVRLGPEADGQRGGLGLSGHLDVVPADEPDWTNDPFALTERDGKWYARGACDMKGFVALAVNLAREIDPAALRAPLVLILTADEEVGSVGAQHLVRSVDAASLPRDVLVGEPTELAVVRMHKGHLKLRVTVPGRSAHSGSPHLGVNAIDRARSVLDALSALRAAMENERTPESAHFTEVPFPVLNLARIRAGDALNVIPDRCEVDVGVRLLPGQDSEAFGARLESVVDGTGVDATVEVINDNPPMLLDEDTPLLQALVRHTGQHGSRGVSFASDAGALQRDLGCACVLYGPGSITVAHRPDEFVPIGDMRRVRTVLEALVDERCGAGALAS